MVISGAGAFRRHHRRPERVFRRAGFSEGRAVVRLLEPLKDQSADADARLGDLNAFDVEPLFRIKLGIGGAEPKAALRNRSDASPLAVGDFEDVADQAERAGFGSRCTAREYWFSTPCRPSSSIRTQR